MGDAECGFVGVVGFSGWSEISDHPKYDVREVDLLADDLSLRRSVLIFDRFRTPYPRPPMVELCEPFGFGELLPVRGSKFALGESTSVTGELGGG